MGAAYVAVALTFSSTIIIVKLLSDKKEIDSLHGRIAVGFLLVQDICAILAMIGLTALGGGRTDGNSATAEVLIVAGKGVGFLVIVALLMRFVLPPLMARLARSQELMVLFAIAWAVLLGAAGDALGFSREVGAFLGGVSLASTGYREAIGARLVGLRDFLLLFFFVDLGARLNLGSLGLHVGSAALLSVFVLVGNPLIVMVIMGFMGYRKRTGFLAGLAVAQISEFSLILGALGVSLGHIDMEAMGLITLVGVVTICMSTYMIIYSGPLYRLLAPWLSLFERRSPGREMDAMAAPDGAGTDVILLGLGNYGGGLAEHLLERRKRVLGVDFDPESLAHWRGRGMTVLYGDVGDPELLDQLPIRSAKWVVSSVRDRELNLTLLKLLRECAFAGKIALAARSVGEARELAAAGAHVVLCPFSDAAEQGADALTEAMQSLPEGVDWPLAVRDIRLKPGSPFTGQALRDIPLRAETGVSILAVSRAGKVHFELSADFRLYPGDRLVLMGDPDNIARAQEYIQRRETAGDDADRHESFTAAEVPVPADSAWNGRTLENLRFRQDFGVTVVGIRRGEAWITSPKASEEIRPGDRLIVVGSLQSVESVKKVPAA
jgi:Trk K+ transport system NAD-binding subunit/Kef-type K+ transport system membrane component KefB